jgi:hypothetical protein
VPTVANLRDVARIGYLCEDDGELVWPATTRTELTWLRNRRHIVAEVARHMQGGIDSWMREGLEFLDEHDGHAVVIVSQT